MIGKSHVGRGFYGCFRYVLGEDEPTKAAHIIGGNMAGNSARELSSEVKLYRQMRPEIEQPVWHVPLAFHPDERLNDAQMQEACTHFLKVFGVDLDHHQHLIVRHHDEPQGHAHVIVNRISDQGKLLDLHRDWPRVKVATRRVEKDLGLRLTVEQGEADKEILRARIAQTAQDHPQLDCFCQSLEVQGIIPRFAYRRGQLHGIVYRYSGMEINGSKLGRDYSFQGLQNHHGIVYQADRDDPLIRRRYVTRNGTPASDDTKTSLRQQISLIAQSRPTLSTFCQQLTAQDIHPQFALRRGKLSKLDYYYQGQKVSGAQLGDEFTFKGVQHHLGIDYQPERDDALVQAQYMKQFGQPPSIAPELARLDPPLIPQRQSPEVQQRQPQRRQRKSQKGIER
ncbi:MAG: relaxase/mobilization nuclease domain-containing protein [Cyanobacteria bacterium P01_A01_bin.123]